MRNIGLLIQSPEELQPVSTVKNHLVTEEIRGQFLELRTDAGAVYLSLSWWQRIRLHWTFRHFHVLPSQVLSRRDQRLIEKLSRSAVVTPALPVASNTIFGVVEKARSKPPASAHRVIPLRAELFLEKSKVGSLPNATNSASIDQEAWGVRGLRLRQLGAATALLAVAVAVILAWVFGISRFSSTGQKGNARTASAPMEQAANGVQPRDLLPPANSPVRAASATTALPNAGKPHRLEPPSPESAPQKSAEPPGGSDQPMAANPVAASPVAANPVAASPAATTIPEPASIVPSGASERRFVSELPQGHFAYPVVSERNLVGELQLRALIGADGSVKEVTALGGNPQLAEAGVRAVRQWRFAPYQALGGPVEVETQIKMKFFGQDAVSITSVANKPTPEPK